MKPCLSVLAAVVVTLTAWSVCLSGEQQKGPDEKKASVWMKTKLSFSQNILAGLTDGDFEKIRKNAQSLNVGSYLEKLFRGDNPDYKRQLSLFDFANRELIRQAEEKNLDGATLAYTQVMISCIQCHKVVRGAKK